MKLRKLLSSMLVIAFALMPVMEVVAQAAPDMPSLPQSPVSPAEPDMPDSPQDPDEPALPAAPAGPNDPEDPNSPADPNDSENNEFLSEPLDVYFLCPADGDLSLTLVLENFNQFNVPFNWSVAGMNGSGEVTAGGDVHITIPLLPEHAQDVEIISDLIEDVVIANLTDDNCVDDDDDNGGNNGGNNGTTTSTSTGTFVLMKRVINENDNGTTTATSTDFELRVNGDGHTFATSSMGSYAGKNMTLPIGKYEVSEATSTQYVFDSSYSAACSFGTFTIRANATTTCTVTNTVTGTTTNNGGNNGGNNGTTTATGTLRLIKQVVNTNENGTTTATSTDFTLMINGNNFATSTMGTSSGTVLTLNTGTYSLSEATSSQYVFTNAFSGACSNGTLTISKNATTTCTITNTVTGTTSPSTGGESVNNDDNDDDDDGNGGGGRSSRRRSSNNDDNDGEVRGVSFGVGGDAGYCDAGIHAYIKYGIANDQNEVVKLQHFLNDELNTDLRITGMYDIASYQAVNTFQVKYGEEILQPWVDIGLHASDDIPTGYFYKTTQWWANTLICDQNYPMPRLP